MAPAKKSPKALTGTITWSETTTANDTSADRTVISETVRSGKIVVNAKARRGSFTGLAGGKASYSQTIARTERELNIDGIVQCTITEQGQASGSGSFTKGDGYPRLIITQWQKRGTAYGKATKAIVLNASVDYSGSSSTNYVGSGLNPCSDGSDTYPINSQEYGPSGGPNSAEWVCFPKGSSSRIVPQAGQLVGARKGKGFVFDCTKSAPSGINNGTVTLKVAGRLKVS